MQNRGEEKRGRKGERRGEEGRMARGERTRGREERRRDSYRGVVGAVDVITAEWWNERGAHIRLPPTVHPPHRHKVNVVRVSRLEALQRDNRGDGYNSEREMK